MTLRQLEAFLAIARVRSFRRASEALHLSSPALSQHIHELEAEFGIRLFDRLGRSSVLTAAGACLRAGRALGLGLAFLSVHAVRADAAAQRLHVVRLRGTGIRRQFHAIHLPERPLPPAAQAIVALLEAEHQHAAARSMT